MQTRCTQLPENQYHAYRKYTGSPWVRDTDTQLLWTQCWSPMVSVIERFHCIKVSCLSCFYLSADQPIVSQYMQDFSNTVLWMWRCDQNMWQNYLQFPHGTATHTMVVIIGQCVKYVTCDNIDWYSGPGLHSFSAGVAPPGVLQSSGYQYQYPLPHDGVGGHQPTFTLPQLLQQGTCMTYYDHYISCQMRHHVNF